MFTVSDPAEEQRAYCYENSRSRHDALPMYDIAATPVIGHKTDPRSYGRASVTTRPTLPNGDHEGIIPWLSLDT